MATATLPDDVAAHLQVAIQLSNRRIHLRFLEEADALLAAGFTNAAAVIVGAVLDAIVEAGPNENLARGDQRIEQWRTLRNAALHLNGPRLSSEQTAEMIRGVRDLLAVSSPGPPSEPPIPRKPSAVRGKYKFVPTSSEAFIERKRDDLHLEHQ